MVTLRCWTALQKNLDKLKNVSTGTLWNSRKTNANSHTREEKNPLQQHKVSSGQLGSSSAGRDLGILVGSELHMSPACPGSRLGAASWAAQTGPEPAEVSPPSQHLSDHIRSCVQNWLPQNTTNWSKVRKEPPWEGSEHFTMRRGSGNQAYSAWRKKDFSIITVQY